MLTPERLERGGRALYGRQWQTQLAEEIKAPAKPTMGVSLRRVQRWASGGMPIPDWVEPEMVRLLELRGMDIRHLLGELQAVTREAERARCGIEG